MVKDAGAGFEGKVGDITGDLAGAAINSNNIFKNHSAMMAEGYDDMMECVSKAEMEYSYLRSSLNDPTSALILV